MRRTITFKDNIEEYLAAYIQENNCSYSQAVNALLTQVIQEKNEQKENKRDTLKKILTNQERMYSLLLKVVQSSPH